MTKQKLFEYCQKNRISSPQFVTTGQGVIFSSAVVVQCLENAEDCQTFYSKEAHTSKKKAENDAAEVALEVINAQIAQCTANSVGKESFQPSFESFLQTISKVVNSARSGIFDRQAKVPAEFLILFSGIQSALNRIDQSFRKDPLGAYSYLLKALYSPLQDFLRVERNSDDQIFVSRISFNSISGTTSWRSPVAQSKLGDTLKFILIPSSLNKKPYEISVNTSFGRNECCKTKNKVNNESDSTEDENDGGSKCVRALSAVKKALNVSGSVAISAPIFTSTTKSYLTGLSKIFCGEDSVEKIEDVAVNDEHEVKDQNRADDISTQGKGDNGVVAIGGIVCTVPANPVNLDEISGIIDDDNVVFSNDGIINNIISDVVITNSNDHVKNTKKEVIQKGYSADRKSIHAGNSEESSQTYFRPRLFIPYQESFQGKKLSSNNRKEFEFFSSVTYVFMKKLNFKFVICYLLFVTV